MSKPLCFIIMPFGEKEDSEGNLIDFDHVYAELIQPAIIAAEMSPIRADEETINGIIHKPMYERLILCDYAIADLSTANANVFYELGIRHAVKPYTTITISSSNTILPFDVNFLRSMIYDYDKSNTLTNLKRDIASLKSQLLNAKKEKTTDSPIYQLVDGIAFQNSVAHEKTDIFRDKVRYNLEIKNTLLKARNLDGDKVSKLEAIDKIVSELKLENEETGVLIDILLSYRAVGAIMEMIAFIKNLPSHVQQTVMVQEQLGFALNRNMQHVEAVAVLERVVEKNGPSSETYGIMGRIYKDLFDKARKEENEMLAESYLDKSIETYLKGFEADWRDAYPGVNALSLLELKGQMDQAKSLAPVVEYSVRRKLESRKPEYWDYATLTEIAVIENNEDKAIENFKKAISCKIEGAWMFDTTINNLKLIQKYREERGDSGTITRKIIDLLVKQKK